ncbi:MAG: transposase [Candidatus Thiodiazotropha sp. (ex Gloverina cf. vestifex)]|nr:transposase [Candidatus Thiodiazotropha sp. (ex Gloverina cf. vestifex)]
MNKNEIEALALAAAKNIKTEKDLCDFSRMLKKITVEAALNAELDDHLGYDKHESSLSENNRNGHSSKTLITEDWSLVEFGVSVKTHHLPSPLV